MIHLKQAVVVEGRYDKAKLASILDAVIIETGGFRIFKDKEKLAMLREIARRQGLIILTDSDTAGFRIRRYLGGSIPKEQIINAYIPDIFGKEKRKDKPSAEGKLGVEGVPAEVIRQALEQAGVFAQPAEEPVRRITKSDFIELGFSGGANSSHLRDQLKKRLGLPEHLSANALIGVLGCILSYEEFIELAETIRSEEENGEEDVE